MLCHNRLCFLSCAIFQGMAKLAQTLMASCSHIYLAVTSATFWQRSYSNPRPEYSHVEWGRCESSFSSRWSAYLSREYLRINQLAVTTLNCQGESLLLSMLRYNVRVSGVKTIIQSVCKAGGDVHAMSFARTRVVSFGDLLSL